MRCCLSARCPENLFLMNKWLKGLSASKHPKHKLHYHRMSQKQANPQRCWEHWGPSPRCSPLSCSLSVVAAGQCPMAGCAVAQIHHGCLSLCTAKPPQRRAGFSLVPVHVPVSGPRQLRNLLWASCSYPGCSSFEVAARTSTDREWECDRILNSSYFCAIFHNIRF